MRRLSIFGLLFGLTLLTCLLLWQGFGPIAQLFTAAGWQILAVPVYYGMPLTCATLSWHYLFVKGESPSWREAFYAMWVGLGINWLLPVAQVGGELTRARLLVERQFSLDRALASVVSDKTLQVFTQALFTLGGLSLFVARRSEVSLGIGAFGGVAVMGAATFAFYRLQQAGLFGRASKLAKRFFKDNPNLDWAESAAAIDAAVRATYNRRDRLVWAILWRVAFRLVLTGESWLALWALGHPVSPIEAMILESLGQGARSAAFAIPGGLGAQEGGIVVVGTALGLPPEVALALSLCKRFRELAVGVPALVAWQIEEGFRLVQRQR
ncbi:MAG: flippase-like domain-containing protein [Cyanobacteria bacterium J06641_5]